MKYLRIFLFLIFSIFVFQADAMTTNGNIILNSAGEPVELKGINWFGFNNGQTMVDGLWSGSDGLSTDFATVVYRLQLLGYNAVRIPFSFKDLKQSPRSFVANLPSATKTQIQNSVTDPTVSTSGKTIPNQNYSPPNATPNVSNSYLPNDTTLNRFLWVVNFFAKNGFYVLIDNHLREDQTLLEKGKNAWVQEWVNLVTVISNDPVSRDKLMIDILNEPDEFNIAWQASGTTPGLGDLYLAVMDAIYPINSKALFFIEGTGQGNIGANWGDGFSTDANLINQNGISDPRPFFNSLLQKPYLNQVVISPHIYPPTITGATSDYSGAGLWNRMTNSFGYLTKQGYCNGTTCHVFPVAIGEFGSRFTDSRDLQSMPDIASYLNNTGNAADGKHQKIGNWFYWSWNPNSSDTGGVVNDDWRTIIWTKVRYMETIGLIPWFLSSGPTPPPPPPPPADTGTLCLSVSPVNGLTKAALKPITVGNYTFTIPDFNTPICNKVPVGSYTVSAPEIILGNTKYTAPTQSVQVTKDASTTALIKYTGTPVPTPASNISVEVQMGTPWEDGAGHYQVDINIFFTNKGTTTINVPWKFTMKNSVYQAVVGSWNLRVNSVSNGTITCTVSDSWEALTPNNPVNVGIIVSSTSKNLFPSEITVNGVPVTIVVK